MPKRAQRAALAVSMLLPFAAPRPVAAEPAVDVERCVAEAIESEACWEALNERVLSLFGADDPDAALPLAERSVRLALAVFGTGHSNVATAYNNLGLVSEGVAAVAVYRQALAAWEAAGEAGAGPIVTYRNLAQAFQSQSAWAEAEQAYRDGARLASEAGLDGELLPTLLALGDMLRFAGSNDAADLELRRALELSIGLYGERHLETARAYRALARNLKSQNRYEEARPFFRRAFDIRLALEGADSLIVAQSRRDLADATIADTPEDIVTQLDEVVRIYRMNFDADDPRLAAVLYDLGAQAFRSGSEAGLATMLEAVARMAADYGAADPRMLSYYRYLAIFLHLAGRHAEEAEYSGRTLALSRKLSESNTDRIGMEAEVALGLMQDGRYPAALSVMRSSTRLLLLRLQGSPRSPDLDAERARKASYFRYFVAAAWQADQTRD